MKHVGTHRPAVVFLEEAIFRSALGTADQRHRSTGEVDHQHRRNRGVIVGKVTLGEIVAREDDPVGTGQPKPHRFIGRGGSRLFTCPQPGRNFADHVGGALVLSQRDEAWVAQDAVAGELGKGDFANEAGLDPGRAPAGGSRHIERGRGEGKRAHPLGQAVDHRRVEPGSDLADVAQSARVAHGEVKRAKAAPLVARLPADDDKFLAIDALDLEPCARAGAAIRGAGLFRDDAFAALLAHRLEQFFALADDMVAEHQWRRCGLHEGGKALLALKVRERPNVLAPVDQQIEGIIGQLGLAAFQGRLEETEVGLAIRPDRDGFAVDQATRRELGRSLRQWRKVVAPVLAVAGPGERGCLSAGEQQTIAVIFILVDPVVSGWDFVDQCRELRSAELRRRDADLALGPSSFLAASVRFPDVLARCDPGHGPVAGHAGETLFDQRIACLRFGVFVGDFL